jgi:hypothetical protein
LTARKRFRDSRVTVYDADATKALFFESSMTTMRIVLLLQLTQNCHKRHQLESAPLQAAAVFCTAHVIVNISTWCESISRTKTMDWNLRIGPSSSISIAQEELIL